MIQIKEEFRKLIPALTAEELNQLEANILKDGIRDPLILWNDILIDGHNRYSIAMKHEIKFECIDMAFDSEDNVKIWMAQNQLGRRNLADYVMGELYDIIEQLEKQIGKEKQLQTLKQGTDIPVLSIIDKTEKHNTQKIVAEKLGWSTGKKAQFDVVKKKAPEEVKQKLRNKEISINQAYQEIKKEEKKIEYKEKVLEARIEPTISENIKNGNSLEILETLENGCIDIVLTDPPYGINYVSNRSIFDNAITKRGLLNDGKDEAFELLDKTCEILQRKTAENAHLYFFCSWAVFSNFEAIISKYFTIKTPIVWDKGNKGSGDLENDWGNQTEIIIYCVKGKKLVNNRRGNLISVSRLHTSKMVHPTQKPDELLKQLLEVSATKGDFIVDPFMGSGSTIKVCNEMKLKSLGIELDTEMFNIANQYING
jgi:site-specific DNA-methyltransferase (adenine-specific)